MTDVDELKIKALNDNTAALNRVADALETHLPTITNAITTAPVAPAPDVPPAKPEEENKAE